jgi:hypothetical protein
MRVRWLTTHFGQIRRPRHVCTPPHLRQKVRSRRSLRKSLLTRWSSRTSLAVLWLATPAKEAQFVPVRLFTGTERERSTGLTRRCRASPDGRASSCRENLPGPSGILALQGGNLGELASA